VKVTAYLPRIGILVIFDPTTPLFLFHAFRNTSLIHTLNNIVREGLEHKEGQEHEILLGIKLSKGGEKMSRRITRGVKRPENSSSEDKLAWLSLRRQLYVLRLI